jgi:hypothetical protein
MSVCILHQRDTVSRAFYILPSRSCRVDDETLHACAKMKIFHLRDYLPNPLNFPALLLGIVGVRRVENTLIGKTLEIPLRTASVPRHPLM